MSDTLTTEEWTTLVEQNTDDMLDGARYGILPDAIAESDMIDADADTGNQLLKDATTRACSASTDQGSKGV